VVGDAYYSKKTFVDGVTRAGKAFVGKLRVDANLKYKYTGSRTGKPGRPKKFDGKVDWKDFSKWDLISRNEQQIVYSSLLYAPALKKDIRVVCILWQFNGQIRREVLLA
jgi:hypothetical protein